MSILTFAIGALLAAVGLTSVYYGYSIVEVERGWTEVIAGTVALVGGMVVMMLALLLRAIRDLRFAAGEVRSALPASSVHAEPFADLTPAPAASLPPVPEPAAPMPAVPEPGLAPGLEMAAREVEAALFGGLEPRPDAVAAAPERAGAAEEAWHRLDSELARLDQEDAAFAPATAPATLEPMAAAMPETPKAGVEASERDPGPEEPELPLAAPEPPPVIGRYEADGTTYTMFADGTIEAETPEGTYHFGSMAELKAFIEAKV